MIPRKLTLRNFSGVSLLEWDIDRGASALIGANGAGKSSRLIAIEYALFGPKGRSHVPFLKRRETEMSVELEFAHGGGTWRVRRGYSARGGGKPWLAVDQLADDGAAHPVTRETAAQTQTLVNGMLQMTRETYRAAAYSPQDDQGSWTKAPAPERSAILVEILDLEEWKPLAAEAKRQRKVIEADIIALERTPRPHPEEISETMATLEHGKAEVARCTIVGEQAAEAVGLASAAVIALEQEAARAEERRTAAQDAAQRATTAARRVTELQKRIDEAEAKFLGVDKLRAQAERIPDLERTIGETRARNMIASEERALLVAEHQRLTIAYGEAQRRHKEAREAFTLVNAQRIAAENRLSEFSTAPIDEQPICPTCGQTAEWGGEAFNRTVTELSAEEQRLTSLTADAAAERDATLSTFHACRVIPEPEPLFLEELAPLEQSLQQAVWAERQLAGLDAVTETIVSLGHDLQEAQNECILYEEQYRTVNALWLATDDVDSGLRAERERLEHAHNVRRLVQAEYESYVQQVASKSATLETLQRLEAAADAADAAVVDLQVKLEVAFIAEKAYGRDGIPSMILENVALPTIQAEANGILEALDSVFRVDLRSQRELASGDVKDELNIVIMTPTGEALYETLSGGEKTRIDVALHIGLAKLLRTRRGADIGMLALDEPDGLDASGADHLASILRDLAAETFPVVLCCSHQDGLRDALDYTIEVAA